ncbi:MAG: phosphatidate cytidylyltransferase [Acidobacteria bacterium]|nr:phosphatidate cytidylyltransferase [Acidobacteriota bacterium]
MSRILTGIVGVSLGLAAVLLVEGVWFFVLCALVIVMATWEFRRIARFWAPRAPLAMLLVTVPALGYGLAFLPSFAEDRLATGVLFAAVVLSVGLATVVLLARTPVRDSLPAVGALAFGTLYFGVPLASLVRLQHIDPWLLVLALAIVWAGDVAALYAGRAFGRRRLAPVVSPNKTWAGAVAGFIAGLAVVAAWSAWHLGAVSWPLMAVGAATACAAQLGDLVESMFKRGAGVKDSGQILPGHGGMFDRLDALLFGAPVMLLGVLLIGLPALS